MSGPRGVVTATPGPIWCCLNQPCGVSNTNRILSDAATTELVLYGSKSCTSWITPSGSIYAAESGNGQFFIQNEARCV
jgi:hypothetical protein